MQNLFAVLANGGKEKVLISHLLKGRSLLPSQFHRGASSSLGLSSVQKLGKFPKELFLSEVEGHQIEFLSYCSSSVLFYYTYVHVEHFAVRLGLECVSVRGSVPDAQPSHVSDAEAVEAAGREGTR